MKIEIIKTHRLHHVESSSVDHISSAGGSTLLTAVVLAREDRSLGALNREERSTLSLRSCADADDDDDDDRKSTGFSPSRYKTLLFPSDSFYPAALSRAPPYLRRMRARVSREFSRLVAVSRDPRASRTIDRLTAAPSAWRELVGAFESNRASPK